MLNDVPEDKQRVAMEIESKETKLKRMHQLQPTVNLANKLRKVEIPQLKSEIEGLVDRFKKLRSESNEVIYKLYCYIIRYTCRLLLKVVIQKWKTANFILTFVLMLSDSNTSFKQVNLLRF